MKKAIAEDGTRTHKLTKTEGKSIAKVMLILEEVALFHRGTCEATAIVLLIEQLRLLHVGKPLVVEPPVDSE